MHGWQAEAAARGGGSRGGRANGLRRDGEELARGQSEAEGQAGHLDQHRMRTGCVSDRRVTRDAHGGRKLMLLLIKLITEWPFTECSVCVRHRAKHFS